MGENVESENKNVSKTSQLSGKKSSKETEKHPRKNLEEEQDDVTIESTYTCPICKEYSNKKFSSVSAHSLKKHGKQLMFDNNNDIIVVSKNREEKDPIKQEEKKLTLYDEVKPADVFLRDFLNEFDFKEQFIDLLCRKVKRRNELPHPNNLSDEIQSMPSGITNPRSASYIAEEYSYDLADYLKQLETANKLRNSMGYVIDSRSHNTGYDGSHHGIPVDRYKGDNGPSRDFRSSREKEKEKSSVDPLKEVRKRHRARKAEYLENLMDKKEMADMERELDGGKEDEEMKRLREENRRLREDNGHQNNPNNELRERIVKLEDDIRRRDEERMQRLEDELKAARNTPPPQQNPGSMSREEVMQMISQNIDVRNKTLSRADLERYVDQRMNDRSALTKGDLTYLEARDKLHLEEKKLDESGKTRDVIASSIRDGFGHAGKIVGRMMTGEGEAGGGTPVSGYSNQEGNMVQMPCPKDLGGCGAVMTAPINSPLITCITCGKRWEVGNPVQQQEFTSKKKEEIEPSEPTTAGGTSESTTDAGVEKIAENIAIGEGVEKAEEELRKKELDLQQRHEENERKREDALKKAEETIKESSVEKKPWPEVDSNICPICNKKCKGKRGVGLHIVEMHPEYER